MIYFHNFFMIKWNLFITVFHGFLQLSMGFCRDYSIKLFWAVTRMCESELPMQLQCMRSCEPPLLGSRCTTLLETINVALEAIIFLVFQCFIILASRLLLPKSIKQCPNWVSQVFLVSPKDLNSVPLANI